MSGTRYLILLVATSAWLAACSGCGGPARGSAGANISPLGAGGTHAGGQAAAMVGGSGGAGVACPVVASLPARGTACTADAGASEGESRCDAKGGRCLCAGGIWFCDDTCSRTRPPAPGTRCDPGSACLYPGSGVICACVEANWMCLGRDACPARAPTTGDPCDSTTGLACDYPGSMHLGCACIAASMGSRWTCLALGRCPAAQPGLRDTCRAGPAVCNYGTTRCACLQSGNPWLCV